MRPATPKCCRSNGLRPFQRRPVVVAGLRGRSHASVGVHGYGSSQIAQISRSFGLKERIIVK